MLITKEIELHNLIGDLAAYLWKMSRVKEFIDDKNPASPVKISFHRKKGWMKRIKMFLDHIETLIV